jgi:hypothetical protein
MRRYEPDERGREIVLRLGALHNVDLESIAFAITNPRTGRPINVRTLKKCYARELKLAKVDMQKLVMDCFVEQLKAGNAQALKIGLSNYCGLREGGGIEITQNNTQNLAWTIVGVPSPNVDEPIPPGDIFDALAVHEQPMRQLPKTDAIPLAPPEPVAKPQQPRTELDADPNSFLPWHKRPLTGRIPVAGRK